MNAQKEVRAMLKANGWNVYTLAKISGVPISTVTRIERGLTDPKSSTMEKLRKAKG